MTCFNEKSGRINLHAELTEIGEDLHICLTGGRAHIGGAAIADSLGLKESFSFPGHREAELAAYMAASIAGTLGKRVAVCAGIHYDAISREEILTVQELVNRLTQDIINAMTSGEIKNQC